MLTITSLLWLFDCVTLVLGSRHHRHHHHHHTCPPIDNATRPDILPEWEENIVPEHYNGRLPPQLNGCPVVVNVSISPWAIGEVDFERQSVEFNLYLQLTWEDYRLQIPDNFTDMILLDETNAAKVWTPHISFRNCLDCNVIMFNAQLGKLQLIGKKLQFRRRENPKLRCDFNISKYPMDTHDCFAEITPFGDLMDTIILQDTTTQFKFARNFSVPQFGVTDLGSGNCSTLDVAEESQTCVEYHFTLRRKVAYHAMVTYAPSTIIVVLSWISFWLDVDAAPARVALGLTALLTLQNQFDHSQKDLPPVAYIKAIDVWMFTCIFMVFASLLEYALAHNVAKEMKSGKTVSTNSVKNGVPNLKSESVAVNIPKIPVRVTNPIDEAAKIGFPLVFLSFNLVYWGYYVRK